MIFLGVCCFPKEMPIWGGVQNPLLWVQNRLKIELFNYLFLSPFALLQSLTLLWIFAPCYTVLFHFLPTVQALLRAFQSCAGSKRFEKVWITNVEPGAGKGWADRFEKFEKVWKVWKVAKRVRRLFKPFKSFKPVGSPFPIFKFDICFFKHFQTCAGLKGWKGAPTSLKAL